MILRIVTRTTVALMLLSAGLVLARPDLRAAYTVIPFVPVVPMEKLLAREDVPGAEMENSAGISEGELDLLQDWLWVF